MHLRAGGRLVEDHGGSVSPDLSAARAEAAFAACETAAERLKAGRPLHVGRLEIRDEAGRPSAAVPLPQNPSLS